MLLRIPGHHEGVKAYGRVVRVCEKEDDAYQMAISSMDIDSREYLTLTNYLRALSSATAGDADQAALLSSMMVTTSPAIGSGLLIAAGAYQITPLNCACLKHCRSPMHFISEHWVPEPRARFGWVWSTACFMLDVAGY